MKSLKKVLVAAFAAVTLLAMTACSAYSPAKEYKNVELNGLKLDIRSDMEFDNTNTDANGNKVEQYYCDYFGVTVTSEPAAAFKQSGCKSVSDYLNAVIDANKLDSKVETSGDKVFIDYKSTVKDIEFAYTAYGLELGYNYYMVQFFAKSGEEDMYRDEYIKIVDSVELAETPAETKEITVGGVKMTVGGDVEQLNAQQYFGADYFVSALVDDYNITAEKYANAIISGNGLITEDGQAPAVTTSEDGVASFEAFSDNQYVYYYFKSVDGKIIYVLFTTTEAADDTLKAEFAEIVNGASIA